MTKGFVFGPLFFFLAHSCFGQGRPDFPPARPDVPQGAFPVMLVTDEVRNRLAEEWAPSNRYQHERAYCVEYTTDVHLGSFFDPTLVIYTLTKITRAGEGGTTPTGLRARCAPTSGSIALLHIHPPTQCSGEDSDGASCTLGGKWAYQCFRSPDDEQVLEQSGDPFILIQCDRWAIVPIWRRGT